MDLDALLVRISDLGASDVHLKLGQPPVVRRDGLIEPLEGEPTLTEELLQQVVETITSIGPGAPAAVRLERRARHRLRVRRQALPRQRVHAARRDLGRLPCDPARDPELRDAPHAAGRPPPRRRAARARARHRSDRIGQVDDTRGDDRPHQPHEEAAHHHDRGSDRDAPSRPQQHRQPARGGDRHRLLLAGAPPRAAPGPGRDPDRRAPRPGDGRDRAAGGRVRPPRLLDHAHRRLGRDDRPDDRVLPRARSSR